MQKLMFSRASALIVAVLAATTLAPLSAAHAAGLEPETVLYSFCAKAGGGKNCIDGANPYAALTTDVSGHLYGTTYGGGTHSEGTVFELTANAAKTKWMQTVLYNFCARSACTDGEEPAAGLIMNKAGHLYGTTAGGGAHFDGTVFELTPNSTKTKWTENVVYSFQGGITDGSTPYAGLIMDAAGDLYGTTLNGGGTVFELTPNAAQTKWTEIVLYKFCARSAGGRTCVDGADPYAGLILDKTGKLYGTTVGGGAHGGGTAFELTPNTNKTKWTEAVLYSFCVKGLSTCAYNYEGPYISGLISDASGKLYGTTAYGGNVQGANSGTVFELTPNAAKTNWTEMVLHSFGTGIDGWNPWAGLIMDRAGHLYGTTIGGGPNFGGGGTVFELAPNAAKTKWTETILYNFCARNAGNEPCVDGLLPFAGLIMDASGHLYGTTNEGGAYPYTGEGGGTVFELP